VKIFQALRHWDRWMASLHQILILRIRLRLWSLWYVGRRHHKHDPDDEPHVDTHDHDHDRDNERHVDDPDHHDPDNLDDRNDDCDDPPRVVPPAPAGKTVPGGHAPRLHGQLRQRAVRVQAMHQRRRLPRCDNAARGLHPLHSVRHRHHAR